MILPVSPYTVWTLALNCLLVSPYMKMLRHALPGIILKTNGLLRFLLRWGYPLHSIEICVEILSKTKLFRPKTATPYNVEPFERILRGLFKAQSPNKFSSFLDLRNHSSRFRLFAREFRRFRFFFSGSACFSKF